MFGLSKCTKTTCKSCHISAVLLKVMYYTRSINIERQVINMYNLFDIVDACRMHKNRIDGNRWCKRHLLGSVDLALMLFFMYTE